MPHGYNAGALIDELEGLKLFVVEHRDDEALLVPAAPASPKPEKYEGTTVAARVSREFAAKVRDEATRRGVTASTFIVSIITEYLANVGHGGPHPALGQDVRSSLSGGYELAAAV